MSVGISDVDSAFVRGAVESSPRASEERRNIMVEDGGGQGATGVGEREQNRREESVSPKAVEGAGCEV